MTATSKPPREVIAQLRKLYRRNGYVRRIDPVRRMNEGVLYKKGAEVRLAAESVPELILIRQLLRQAGFSTAKPFRKGKQWRQPLYGVKEVARFLALIRVRLSREKAP